MQEQQENLMSKRIQVCELSFSSYKIDFKVLLYYVHFLSRILQTNCYYLKRQ